MNMEKLLQNPADSFAQPKDVCTDSSLSLADKIKILRRWEYDARELQVADEENMSGGPPDQLGDILAALSSLGHASTTRSGSPTKHGGA